MPKKTRGSKKKKKQSTSKSPEQLREEQEEREQALLRQQILDQLLQLTPLNAPSSSSNPNNDGTGNRQEKEQQPQQSLEVGLTPLEHLLSLRRPQQLAAELAQSLVSLRARLAQLELEKLNADSELQAAAMAKRAQDKGAKLEHEILKTEKLMRRLLLMTQVVDKIVNLREVVFAQTRAAMEAEVTSLREQLKVNEGHIHDRYVARVNMLHRYWLWRTLQELGDVTVGETFEAELARGPRYRSVGLQNNILSDTLEQQLLWLRRFAEKEEVFRSHVRRLDNLVEELTDINEVLEDVMTCRVCGLLFEDPVLFWPCGHTFCLVCFDSLSIAPSLFRCPTCGSIGSEGYVHSLLVAESVAKWMFKDAGYGDIHGALSLIRLHLSKFRKDLIVSRITALRQRLAEVRERETRPESSSGMSISYRAF